MSEILKSGQSSEVDRVGLIDTSENITQAIIRGRDYEGMNANPEARRLVTPLDMLERLIQDGFVNAEELKDYYGGKDD